MSRQANPKPEDEPAIQLQNGERQSLRQYRARLVETWAQTLWTDWVNSRPIGQSDEDARKQFREMADSLPFGKTDRNAILTELRRMFGDKIGRPVGSKKNDTDLLAEVERLVAGGVDANRAAEAVADAHFSPERATSKGALARRLKEQRRAARRTKN